MAIAFDTHFASGTNAGAAGNFAYNVGSGNVQTSAGVGVGATVMIATVGVNASQAATGTVSVLWNGVSMTLIGSVSSPGGAWTVYMFGLINPDSGQNSIAFNWTGGNTPSIGLGAVTFTGSDTSTGWNNFGSDNGTGSPANSTITSSNGDMGVAGHINANGASTAIGTGTSDWIDTANDGNKAEARNPSSGSTVQIGWTFTGSVEWVNAKVNVIQPGGGGGGGPVVLPDTAKQMERPFQYAQVSPRGRV